MPVEMHDGSRVLLKKLDREFDPTSRANAFSYLRENNRKGIVVTGLIYIRETLGDMHDLANTVDEPLNGIPYERLSPGAEALEKIQAGWK